MLISKKIERKKFAQLRLQINQEWFTQVHRKPSGNENGGIKSFVYYCIIIFLNKVTLFVQKI